MAATSSPAPEIIGNYVVEHALAQGSMGTVYQARHSLTYARVALKVLRADLAVDAQAEERFLREVRAAAQIGHDGIVRVQDAGKTADGHLYLAMELLAGETLEERITRAGGDRLIGLDWLLAMLEPLAAAHAHSIVHRDLKPANVFIARAADGSERVKLLDFGLARDTREKSGTQTGIALGTPYYMSPEQATRPKDVSPASDVWSVGVMMYELLTGMMPFDGETLHAVVIKAATVPHLPVADAAPGTHPALAALVDDCLSKDPGMRPHDASALLMRLEPLLADEGLRSELSVPLALAHPGDEPERMSDSGAEPRDGTRMPFADTAIALAHDSRIQDIHPRTQRSHLGLWIGALAILALVTVGIMWVVDRSQDAAASAPPEPTRPARGSGVSAQPPAGQARKQVPAVTVPGTAPAPEPLEPSTVPRDEPIDKPRVPPPGVRTGRDRNSANPPSRFAPSEPTQTGAPFDPLPDQEPGSTHSTQEHDLPPEEAPVESAAEPPSAAAPEPPSSAAPSEPTAPISEPGPTPDPASPPPAEVGP